jgi:glycosyltransferase involved in cell wall biosynthesis
LAKNGYSIDLIVLNDGKNDEKKCGVNIISTKYKPKGKLGRIFKSPRKLYLRAIETKADIFHLHDPELLFIANKLKKNGKKVVFDFHEDVPSDIEDKEWIPYFLRKLLSKFYNKLEMGFAKNFDGIITVTPSLLKKFKEINPNSVMITNYPIIEGFKTVQLDFTKKGKNICYTGMLHQYFHHDKILDAISTLNDIKYLLAGTPTPGYLQFLEKHVGWDKVEYFGVVSQERVEEIYSKSLAGMILHSSNTTIKGEGTLGSNKFFQYMRAGLPIICTNFKLWREIVEKYKCGICVDPFNSSQIASAIKYFIDNPKEAQIMGENGQKAVIEDLNWTKQEKILLEFYSKL